MSTERDQEVTRQSLTFYSETLDWLKAHHAHYAQQTSHDLQTDDRANAIWKLSGQSLALATALIDLLGDGYTGQAWPIMRAIHESNRLLSAATDVDEERIMRRWLADQEVKQSEARAAEQRQAERIFQQMQAAGLEPLTTDVGQLAGQVYRGMSKAAHHRRSVVDEAVDPGQRTMIYGPDPRPGQRLEYAIFGGALIQEVLLKVSDALCVLYGLGFYVEHLTPMLRRFEETLEALDVIDAAKRLGL